MNPESMRDYGYVVQLLHPPSMHKKEVLVNLFSRIGKIHDISESSFKNSSARFIRRFPTSEENSEYVFSKDRLTLSHRFVADVQFDLFSKCVEDVLDIALKTLEIPLFVEQSYIVRILANPLKITDSRVFLGEDVCGLDKQKLVDLERPIHAIGLRLFFPATAEKQYEFDIKIETLLREVQTIFIENRARFFAPIQKDQVSRVGENFALTKEFITKNICNFLVQFNERR